MAEYSHHNLCATLEPRVRYTTLPCRIPREKVTGLYHRLAAEDGDDSHIWDTAHTWDDHAGGITPGARCERCGLARNEVHVRINPKTGEPVSRRKGSIARAI